MLCTRTCEKNVRDRLPERSSVTVLGRSSVGHGGVSQDGTFLSVGKRFLDPRGSEPSASKKSDLGRWMAALGPLVLGAWPGRPSTKAGNG